jgi:hypothetical protein
MVEFFQSKYFIYGCGILYLFFARFQLRKKPTQQFMVEILLKITLFFGGFVSYFMKDYTLGLLMHGLYLLDWILFKNLKTVFKKIITLFFMK